MSATETTPAMAGAEADAGKRRYSPRDLVGRRRLGSGGASAVGGRRRSPLRIALALLFVLASAAGAAALFSNQQKSVAVVVAARPIAAGQRISAGDLVEGSVSSGDQGFAAMKWENRATTAVGKVARIAIPAQALMTTGMVGSDIGVPKGHQAVGVKVAAGQIPGEISAGSRVWIISIPGANAAARSTKTARIGSGLVMSVRQDPNGSGSTLATIRIADKQAPRVAAAAAAGQVALTLMAGR